ncbi:hypothetical protein GCM10023238_05740 [Streptomyces heliomycini]
MVSQLPSSSPAGAGLAPEPPAPPPESAVAVADGVGPAAEPPRVAGSAPAARGRRERAEQPHGHGRDPCAQERTRGSATRAMTGGTGRYVTEASEVTATPLAVAGPRRPDDRRQLTGPTRRTTSLRDTPRTARSRRVDEPARGEGGGHTREQEGNTKALARVLRKRGPV